MCKGSLSNSNAADGRDISMPRLLSRERQQGGEKRAYFASGQGHSSLRGEISERPLCKIFGATLSVAVSCLKRAASYQRGARGICSGARRRSDAQVRDSQEDFRTNSRRRTW